MNAWLTDCVDRPPDVHPTARRGGDVATYDHEMPQVPSKASAIDVPTRERVEQVLNLIRPAVQSDGGDVELVDVTPDGIVQIRLLGACVGCPSSTMTLQVGIERNLRSHVPGVRGVQALP